MAGLSRFCLKIPNPDQYAIGIGKIPISTRVVIFSSNSHKRKRNAEYLTLMSRKTEEKFVMKKKPAKVAIKLPKIFDRMIFVLEHQKWHFRASRFRHFQTPLANISQKILSRFKSVWRLDSLR